MKILFVCGCLEPGNDGVGDYVRRLADGCRAFGCEVIMLALNDRHVSVLTVHSATGHQVVRVPSCVPTKLRRQVFSETVAATRPELVSLQYSPFAYDRWGIAGSLSELMSTVPQGVMRHVLLHELWLERRDGGWKTQLRGNLQKLALRRLLATWKPAVVQTTNETYQERLAKIGVSAQKLPLLSNVPVCEFGDSRWLERQVTLLEENRSSCWLFGTFGTIHPEWDGETALRRLIDVARRHDRTPVILSIGRTNSRAGRWNEWRQKFGKRIVQSPLGERPVEQISEFFQKIDFGLSTNPLLLTGKSGSVTAMLDHGLPVIVFRLEEASYPPPIHRAELMIPADEALDERISRAKKLTPQDRLPTVAREFLDAFR
jgi:hypothetical protein